MEKEEVKYRMLKKIYQELVQIRKELQAIRSSKESLTLDFLIDGEKLIREIASDRFDDRFVT